MTDKEKNASMPVGLTEKKERNPSTTYTIKSFKGVIQKMHKLKMVDDKEFQTLKDLHKKVLNRWIGLELGE